MYCAFSRAGNGNACPAFSQARTVMTELFDHPLITLWYHEVPKIVHHQVHRATYGSETEVFKQALKCGAEAMRVNGASKWLSDDRSYYVPPPELQEWAANTWFPEAVAAGWRYWAIVQPETAVTKLYMSRITSEIGNQGIDVRVFRDAEAALAWLESLP